MDWDNDHRKVSTIAGILWALHNCDLSYPSQKQEDDKSHHRPWWLPKEVKRRRAMSDRLKLQVSCGRQSKPSRSTEMVFLVMWKLTLFPESVQISASGHWSNSISEGLVMLYSQTRSGVHSICFITFLTTHTTHKHVNKHTSVTLFSVLSIHLRE